MLGEGGPEFGGLEMALEGGKGGCGLGKEADDDTDSKDGENESHPGDFHGQSKAETWERMGEEEDTYEYLVCRYSDLTNSPSVPWVM